MSGETHVDVRALFEELSGEGVEELRHRFLLATALGKPVAIERVRRLLDVRRARTPRPPALPRE
jgi:hypothetical protein